MKTITVYEQTTLKVGRELSPAQLRALESYYHKHNRRYFDLVYKGIRLRAYVGLLRVGELTIEVLPKAATGGTEAFWRNRLTELLQVAGELPLPSGQLVQAGSRRASFLHSYLERFADRIAQILRNGRIGEYAEWRGQEGTMGGRLLVAENLRTNALHRERFFVARDRFGLEHPLDQVLRAALPLAERLAETAQLAARFRKLREAFDAGGPASMGLSTFTTDFFRRLRFDRRTKGYRPVIAIARLLLLGHRPGIVRIGQEQTVALLIDMNRLWESFLEECLRRYLTDYDLQRHQRLSFWTSDRLSDGFLVPDFVLYRSKRPLAVLDAKWKLPERGRPATQDLYQLYAYGQRLGVNRVGLLYPGAGPRVKGRFVPSTGDQMLKGDLIRLPIIETGLEEWMQRIAQTVRDFLAESR